MRERSGGALTSASDRSKSLRQGRAGAAIAPLKALLRVMNAPGVSINEGTLELYEPDAASCTPMILSCMAGQRLCQGGRRPAGRADHAEDLEAEGTANLRAGAGQSRSGGSAEHLPQHAVRALGPSWSSLRRATRALLNQAGASELGYNEEMILFCAAYARDAEKPMPYLDKLLTAYHAQGHDDPRAGGSSPHDLRRRGRQQSPPPHPRRVGRARWCGEQQYTQRTYEDPQTSCPHGCSSKIKELKGDA